MNNPREVTQPMIPSARSGRRDFLAAASLAACLPATVARAAELTEDQAKTFIEQTSRDLTAAINGSGNAQQKAASLAAIVDRAVDVMTIGRFCLGRFWRKATPAQQTEYLELFHRVLVLNITGKVGDYEGVTIAVQKAAAREDGVGVITSVSRPNNAPNRVDWLVSAESGSPKVIDVIAEGTSLRLTQRNDYMSYLTKNNDAVQSLIDALRKQAAAPQG